MRSYWDERARKYGVHAVACDGTDTDELATNQVMEAWVEKHDVLLDFGCGTGRIYDTLIKHCNRYIGVDISEEMLRLFRKHRQLRENDNLIYMEDECVIPLTDESVDAIVVNAVLQHVLDSQKLIKIIAELKRVLKTDGVIYLHESMSKGALIKQPVEYQRIRPRRLYGSLFYPEVKLYHLDNTFDNMTICRGVKQALKPVGDKIILDIGCGKEKETGVIGLDIRRVTHYDVRTTDILSDGQHIPFADKTVDEVHCENLLEHFANPYPIIMEVHRVLKDDGVANFIVPFAGSRSANGDPSHKFLMDGDTWYDIFSGFFDNIGVYAIGSFFAGTEKWKKWQKKKVEEGLYGMAQGGRYRCTKPKRHPEINYVPWWLDEWVKETCGPDLV